MTVNQRSPSLATAGPPIYIVHAGQLLDIGVVVTVPPRAEVSGIWLGISTGTIGGGRQGPTGVDPILAHCDQLLTAGLHSFQLQCRVPAESPAGARLYLAAHWASRQPPTFEVSQFIGEFAIEGTYGTTAQYVHRGDH